MSDIGLKGILVPRIAVVGNCQVLAIADLIRFFVPNSYVKPVISWEIEKWYPGEGAFFEDLAGFDLVFSHNTPLIGEISSFQKLHSQVSHSVEAPIIVFPAFHPDMIYANITLNQHSLLSSPLGAYNSAIALMAFRLGISATAAQRLFSAEIYQALGYFEYWEESEAALFRIMESAGADLKSQYYDWSRSGGCFMFSTNHPKLIVLADVARDLLNRAGIATRASDWSAYVPDPSQNDAVWPVYPEIGERFGIGGDMIFRIPNYIAKGENSYIDLERFIHKSYESYSFFPKRHLTADRITPWLEDDRIISVFNQYAR